MTQGWRLSPDEAARYTCETVLGGDWAIARPDTAAPDYTVAAQGGDFATPQEAIDHALSEGPRADGRPRVIALAEGFYAGPVYVPRAAPPLVIAGAGKGKTVIAAGIDCGMNGETYRARFGAAFATRATPTRIIFERIAARETLGTFNTGVLRIEADDVTVTGLSVENLYACDRAASAPAGATQDTSGRFAEGQHQAVALHVAGADRVALCDLHLRSFQDTLYLNASHERPSRVVVTQSLIEGDVDFIFGQATAWFERCEIRSRGERGAPSWVAAPSTAIRTPYGFVFHTCTFTHDGAERGREGGCFLGRQWFEGVRATPYGHPCTLADRSDESGLISRTTLEAVGKCVVLNSRLGGHIDAKKPWDDWGTKGHARYRPAQSRASDFLGHLGPWLADQGMDYSDLDPREIWLGIAP